MNACDGGVAAEAHGKVVTDRREPLAGIDPASVYRHGAQRYSGSHLTAVGLPVRWTAEHDAELVVLRRA